MSKLPISKLTEAKVIATIWNMGAESLDPESYIVLESIIALLCETRSINNEVIATEQRILSGRRLHGNDCHTSDAPAEIPAPCNCNWPDPLAKQIAIDEGYFGEICAALNIDPNSDFSGIVKAIESLTN
jgi:hypothetical protein